MQFADEIIILDSFSTDKTLELLKHYNCVIHQQKFKGYSQQKQDAIDLANNDWVLLLDSDEFLSQASESVLSNWKKKHTKSRCL